MRRFVIRRPIGPRLVIDRRSAGDIPRFTVVSISNSSGVEVCDDPAKSNLNTPYFDYLFFEASLDPRRTLMA
jgi:hypothetical protein